MAHSKKPSTDQALDMIDECIAALKDLKHGARVTVYDELGRAKPNKEMTPNVAYLLALMSSAYRDGHRTSSRPTGSPANIKDDEDVPMPPLSDPVGELVVSDHRITDPIRFQGEIIFRNLMGALGQIRTARGALIEVAQHTETFPGEEGCVSCAMIGVFEEVFRDARCSWCYKFRLAEKCDPPIEILQARKDGTRITQQMVTRALEQPKTKRKKKKGRAA